MIRSKPIEDSVIDATTATGADTVTVCVCSYRRPALLERLLVALVNQKTNGNLSFSCVVVDNDPMESARSVVERMGGGHSIPIQYSVEVERNLASVRNHALRLVDSQFIAFIDDDEVPGENWLLQLWRTLNEYDADAVFGPVRPYFEGQPPKWIVRSKICERPEFPTGTALHWRQTRTGNVLLRSSIVSADRIQFDPAFPTGGEDVDFFRRAALAGKSFVWCGEAPAFELVPQPRLSRRYYLKRALLQGRISAKYAMEHPSVPGKIRVAAKAFAGTVVYTCSLPILFLVGHHVGMKYLIKDCHHVARLLAILGVSVAESREF